METVIHTTTEHKIGATTYYIVSAPSEKATEPLYKKVEKLIKKDMRGTAATLSRTPLSAVKPSPFV